MSNRSLSACDNDFYPPEVNVSIKRLFILAILGLSAAARYCGPMPAVATMLNKS
jgi:hypothetical protein